MMFHSQIGVAGTVPGARALGLSGREQPVALDGGTRAGVVLRKPHCLPGQAPRAPGG